MQIVLHILKLRKHFLSFIYQQEIKKATINNAGKYLYIDILEMYTPYFSCYY